MGSSVLKGQCGAGISTSGIPVVPVRVRVDYLEVMGSIQTLMSLAFCLLPPGYSQNPSANHGFYSIWVPWHSVFRSTLGT